MDFKKASAINKIFKDKEYYMENLEEDLPLLRHEKNVLSKINYYKRIDIDLANIGTLHKLEKLNFNKIERNRFYNDVLYFCNEKK